MAQSVNDIIAANEKKRQAIVEKMYLNFFNDGLLEQGYITPEQHRKMKVQIATRKPKSQSR